MLALFRLTACVLINAACTLFSLQFDQALCKFILHVRVNDVEKKNACGRVYFFCIAVLLLVDAANRARCFALERRIFFWRLARSALTYAKANSMARVSRSSIVV